MNNVMDFFYGLTTWDSTMMVLICCLVLLCGLMIEFGAQTAYRAMGYRGEEMGTWFSDLRYWLPSAFHPK